MTIWKKGAVGEMGFEGIPRRQFLLTTRETIKLPPTEVYMLSGRLCRTECGRKRCRHQRYAVLTHRLTSKKEAKIFAKQRRGLFGHDRLNDLEKCVAECCDGALSVLRVTGNGIYRRER